MVGEYPTQGWRYWAFLAGTITLGCVGVVFMLAIHGSY